MGLVCLTDQLVLQAPPAVFEGDRVLLRCHAKESIPPGTLEFYKDDEALSFPGQSSELHIPHANLGNNGEYKCSGKKGYLRIKTSSKTFRIQVQGTALIILNALVRDRLPVGAEDE